MSIDLKKKQPYDLTKRETGLRKLLAGLSWDKSVVGGVPADCDVSVFMLTEGNKVPGDGYFVFYNNLASEDGAVRHSGDNRDGAGAGDDEAIELDLSKITSEVVQLIFAVTIHESEARGHHFGNVRNASIRLVNAANNKEICKFTLTEQFGDADAMLLGRLFRDDKEWKFEAMGDPFGGGLAALVDLYT